MNYMHMTDAEIEKERTRMSWGWYPDGRNVLTHIERRTAPSTHTPYRKRDDGEWEFLANAGALTYIDCDEEEAYRLAKEEALNTPENWVLVKDEYDNAEFWGSGFATILITQLEAMNAMTEAEWEASEYR
jgi:hypothetical protein